MGVLGLSVGGVWACVWARVNELACDKSSGFRQALARLRRGGEAVAPSPPPGVGGGYVYAAKKRLAEHERASLLRPLERERARVKGS